MHVKVKRLVVVIRVVGPKESRVLDRIWADKQPRNLDDDLKVIVEARHQDK